MTLFLRSVEELLALAVSVCGVRFGIARIAGEAPVAAGAAIPAGADEPLARIASSQSTLLEILEHAELAHAGLPAMGFYASVLLLDETGRPHGTFAVFDDRKRALTKSQEDALLSIAAQVTRVFEMARALPCAAFRPLIHAAPVAVFSYSVDSARFTYVNPKFAETLGYTAEKVLALGSVTDIITEDQRDAVREMIQRREAGDDRQVHYTTKVRCRDGTVVDAEIHSSIADVDGGRMVIGVAIDITERKRRECELAQFERLTSLGRLSAQIAHEFNNVLMGIQSVTEAIRRRAADDPTLMRFTDVIAASLKRGKRLTTDVLRFGQPARLVLGAVDVQQLFRQIADEVRPLLGDRIELRVVWPERLFAHGDAAQLAQVLINLALNARDAMETAGGTLTLEAISAPDGFVRISVRDTGSGIAADDLPYIFEPLFTTKNRGTGLGLSVAYQVVAAHGGRIVVESKPGEGTAFHVFIPTAAADAEEPEEEAAPAAVDVRASVRVLIVDDDESVAAGLQWTLEAAGMDIRVAGTGREVAPAIEAWQPDVIVLDLSLPDEDGRAVYERISERYALPVVFSSGHVSDADLAELLKTPRTRFLMKPYHTDALVAAIRELTGDGRD